MSDENNFDSVFEKLNSPEMSDTIKNILGSFSTNSQGENQEENTIFSDDVFSKLFSSINSSNLDLLIALKPYLNKKRQKKIDQCENFISIIKTFDIINTFSKNDL